ncbi:MAG TPA: FG-GAP-like repeat-containing protein [Planctomycetota bacterium]|nr:FG-GAP-like repeat-containing protein [Planctomycetota bacterium]
MKRSLPLVAIGLVVCVNVGRTAPRAAAGISAALFVHHFIAQDYPGGNKGGSGYCTGGLADFNHDGKLEFAFGHTSENYFWNDSSNPDAWDAHVACPSSGTLGGNTFDVDQDGWPDIVSGRSWCRNNHDGTFTRYEYDSGSSEVHDVAFADMNGDGKIDVVTCSEAMGIFWYDIPANPNQNGNWPRHLITDDALTSKERIHGGFFPRGLGDLNKDGRVDVVAARYWYENRNNGTTWIRHDLPFSRGKGPYGWSSRSWIVDMDHDGNMDIVMTDADQANSRCAILFSNGANPPAFTVLELPKTAPGTRGSFHSLAVADFDGDGDLDIFTVEQDDPGLAPQGAMPRWYVWENLDGSGKSWAERVIYDGKLGGHDAFVGDVDGDGDIDIVSKVWAPNPGNAVGGRFHADYMENLSHSSGPPPALPSVPSGLSATAISSSQIRLNWTDTSGNETGFQIERATAAGGPWTTIATVGANTATVTDGGLASSTAYGYRVRANGSAGPSGYSNTATATTSPPTGGSSIPAAGLAFWVKADAGVATSGSSVTQWSDQSGNGRNATQSTAGSQPVLLANGGNGKPAVQFDGSNDFLQFGLDIHGWTGMTIVMVASASTDPTGGANGGENAPLFWDETASWGWTFLSPFQTSVKLRFGTTQTGNLAAFSRPASIGSAFSTTISRHGNDTDALFVNGTQVWSAAGKLASINGASPSPWIGRGASGTYFAGKVAEILVYDRAISDPERQSIEAAFAAKYTASAPPPPPGGSGTGLLAEYFSTPDLTGSAVVRTDATVDFDWGSASPAPSVPADGFSVRWSGQVSPLYGETYAFTTTTDDGVRLWVNGTLLIDDWTSHPATDHTGSIALTAGHAVDLRMEFFDGTGDAVAKLGWSSASQAAEPIPAGRLFPAAAPSGGAPPAAAAVRSGGGGCGLLGLEPALIPVLLGLLRRSIRS